MKYFRIYESTNLKEIGAYPQATSQVVFDLKTLTKPHINTFDPFKRLPDDFFFPVQLMTKKSKLTDLISFATNTSYGLFISKKLSEIIKPHVKDNAQTFPVQVLKNDVLIDYVLLHFHHFSFENIDYAHTEIWKMKNTWEKAEPLKIQGEQELLKAFDSYTYPEGVEIEQLSFKEDLNVHCFSLFYLFCGRGYFVSEYLREKIETAGCTGIRFLEVNERL
ncbi:MAG: hypothetical protein HYX40_09525 [Sphingobacteriales bacterium]|nr:hypothetical protein [Sphingobacteriales bacterium]